MTSRLAALCVVALIASTSACNKPKPPQLTPKEAKVTSVDITGFDMRVKMEAFNPNAIDLTVQTVSAHVVVDGNQDLGTVTSTAPVTLPASKSTVIDVPMNVKWQGLGGLASIAAAKSPVPYTVDGTATVGGERLNVDIPFKMTGTLTQEQLNQALVKSLKNLPAGLQGIPGLK